MAEACSLQTFCDIVVHAEGISQAFCQSTEAGSRERSLAMQVVAQHREEWGVDDLADLLPVKAICAACPRLARQQD